MDDSKIPLDLCKQQIYRMLNHGTIILLNKMNPGQIGGIKADNFKIQTGCPFHLNYSVISNLCDFVIGTEKTLKLIIFT